MCKMFMNVKEVMEVLEVSESYAYKLMMLGLPSSTVSVMLVT